IERLPVTDQDRIAVLWTYRVPGTDNAVGTKSLDEIRHRSTTMRDIAAVAHWGAVATPLADGERTHGLAYGLVSSNFFEVLGARAELGRLFRADVDDAPSDLQAAPKQLLSLVLSHRAWLRDFGGDSSVIG